MRARLPGYRDLRGCGVKRTPSCDYDLVVVGAGPAGATAARFAAAGGARVLLLDRKRDPGAPVRCGEGVSHRGLSRFIEPNPAWISANIDGARLYSPSGTPVEIATLGAGYVLERKIFDRALIELAVANGAEMLAEANATGLLLGDRGEVQGVRFIHAGKQRQVSCHIVIGADGVDSRVGRWAGIPTHIRLADMESCVQYLVADCPTGRNYCEFYLGDDLCPGGYAWIFPKGNGLANVGLGISAKHANKRGHAREFLDAFIAKKGLQKRILGCMVGGVPVAHTLERIVGDGIMLVGDAARQVNPMTGGGIITGMLAGQLAGEEAAAALRNEAYDQVALQNYRKRWDAEQGKTNHRWYRIKEAVGRLPDATLNDTARVFEGVDAADLTLFKIFARIFRRHPKLLWDIRHVFMA
jgi:digeranylgeranylglycerophospholipid reductase